MTQGKLTKNINGLSQKLYLWGHFSIFNLKLLYFYSSSFENYSACSWRGDVAPRAAGAWRSSWTTTGMSLTGSTTCVTRTLCTSSCLGVLCDVIMSGGVVWRHHVWMCRVTLSCLDVSCDVIMSGGVVWRHHVWGCCVASSCVDVSCDVIVSGCVVWRHHVCGCRVTSLCLEVSCDVMMSGIAVWSHHVWRYHVTSLGSET